MHMNMRVTVSSRSSAKPMMPSQRPSASKCVAPVRPTTQNIQRSAVKANAGRSRWLME
eukprot:gene20944-27794_t